MGLTKLTFGSKWDTSKVTDMSAAFAGLVNLKELDLSNFYISANCNIDYDGEAEMTIGMLQIGNSTYPPQLAKLITPKYVGKAIDISTLGLSLNGVAQTTIAVNTSGSASLTLTK